MASTQHRYCSSTIKKVYQCHKFPSEPSFDSENDSDQYALYQRYLKMKLIGYTCSYCYNRGREGGPQINTYCCKEYLKTLLQEIGKDSDITDVEMPSQLELIIDDRVISMTSTEFGDSIMNKLKSKLVIAKLKEVIKSDPSFKIEFDTWLKTIKSVKASVTEAEQSSYITKITTFDCSGSSFVKVGTLCGLTDLGFSDTIYAKGHGFGAVNHMTSVDESLILYTFDWPEIRTLIYLYACYPGFGIGIMRVDHCHGN
jgi:hypothetical protein